MTAHQCQSTPGSAGSAHSRWRPHEMSSGSAACFPPGEHAREAPAAEAILRLRILTFVGQSYHNESKWLAESKRWQLAQGAVLGNVATATFPQPENHTLPGHCTSLLCRGPVLHFLSIFQKRRMSKVQLQVPPRRAHRFCAAETP